MLKTLYRKAKSFLAHLDYALRDPYDVAENNRMAEALTKDTAPSEPAAPESDWNAALTSAAKLVKDRNVHGYVPDYGCFACFDAIEKAILGLKR